MVRCPKGPPYLTVSRLVSSRAFRAFYNYLEPGSEPDPGGRRGHTPLFYDPGTGRLHNEAVSASGARWSELRRVMKNKDRAMAGGEPAPRCIEMTAKNVLFAHPLVGEVLSGVQF